MDFKPLLYRSTQLALALTLLLSLSVQPAFAQQEPSPIDIQLIVPAQVGPGQLFEVQIKYDAVDPNAGADLNYNVFGPCRIWSRDPEPPNPIVNTWKPTVSAAKGAIKIQIRVDEGTDGQTIRHQVEVRWGPKNRVFDATTTIRYVPPTATPTPTPRPTRSPAQPTPIPSPTVAPVPAAVALTLAQPSFVDIEGNLIVIAEVNQTVGLDIRYTSSIDLENALLTISFEPDVVNLDNAVYIDGHYVIDVPTLAASAEETVLFGSLLLAHIRPYAEGGETYELRATISLAAADDVATATAETEAIEVSQPTVIEIAASVETEIVQAGGGIIIHAVCTNPGATPVKWLKLQVEGLPEGFVLSPQEQSIDVIDADGGRVERLFTVRVPDEYTGFVTFNVVGLLDGATRIEAAPITVELSPPSKLILDAVAEQTLVRAGQAVYVNVICTNEGRFTAQEVTIKLIDTSGNLGVLFQDLGDIEPGESRQAVFVVEIPQDFAADATVSLAAQAVAADGTLSQSQAISIAIECVPVLALEAKSPTINVRAGQPAEIVASVTNSSQCAARNVTVSVSNLPQSFAQLGPQTILELGPGQTRLLSFSLSVPKGHQGSVTFDVQATADGGVLAPAVNGSFSVGGVPLAFTLLFWLLVVAAVTAIVVGSTLYFKNR
ncbi:MAG: hypothetical protein JW934_24725 [Anaerolineae bacterium]|nr:hypothetical protein [Anaerolineae bacterium]